jgi:hypothetical protein
MKDKEIIIIIAGILGLLMGGGLLALKEMPKSLRLIMGLISVCCGSILLGTIYVSY